MLGKVRGTFEVFSCLHSFSASILSLSLSAVFFLISLFLQRVSSLCQSYKPVKTNPTCAKQVILLSGEESRGRKGEEVLWGAMEVHVGEAHYISNRSSAVWGSLAWMLMPRGGDKHDGKRQTAEFSFNFMLDFKMIYTYNWNMPRCGTPWPRFEICFSFR